MPTSALFEIGPAFAEDAPDGQRLVAAGLRAGTTPRHWLAPARGVDAMDAKADLWAALAALGVPMEALTVTADAPGFYHPGPLRHGAAGAEDGAGPFGELHPRVLAALDLPGPAVRVRDVPGRHRRAEAPPQGARPTCRRSSRCAAISPSWWTAT